MIPMENWATKAHEKLKKERSAVSGSKERAMADAVLDAIKVFCNQESLFDTWTGSETFGKLTYTQHLALLALPFSDRQEFVEKNNAEDMSTRQLQKAVQDQLDEERRLHEKTREDLETAEFRARDAEQNLIDMQQRLSAAKSSEGAWQEEIDKINAEKEKAVKAESDATKKVAELQKELKEAKNREDAIRAQLKKHRKIRMFRNL